jgi:hypothetical protein
MKILSKRTKDSKKTGEAVVKKFIKRVLQKNFKKILIKFLLKGPKDRRKLDNVSTVTDKKI